MRQKPPCKREGRDCEKRYIGCQSWCEEYQDWLAAHEEEKSKYYAAKRNEADSFLISQINRINKRKLKDEIRGHGK